MTDGQENSSDAIDGSLPPNGPSRRSTAAARQVTDTRAGSEFADATTHALARRDQSSNTAFRRFATEQSDLWVIKIGSRVLTDPTGQLDTCRITTLAQQMVAIANSGKKIVLVSSGAVAAGMGRLGLRTRPTDLPSLQAVAAVGQTQLVQAYEREFAKLDRHAAQILLTAADLRDRNCYLNVRNTIGRLLEMGCLPIINENDTVAIEELQTSFGDNDQLAAQVSSLFHRPMLILLSDVAALFDRPPSGSNADPAQRLAVVHQIDHSIQALAVDRSNPTSKGGMTSKLRAAKLATSNGATVWLASGKMDNVLLQISNAEDIGTLFKPEANGSSGRKRWIGTAAQVAGHVTIDRGAAHAIVDSSGSLLAVGITAIGGTFEKGDLISIHDSSQKEIARGLTNYSAEQLQNLVGRQSTEFAEILGSCPYDEIIHRNNMTLSDQG